MSDTGSILSGIAVRYATAIFELAKDTKKLLIVEKDFDLLAVALNESEAFNALISSPIYTCNDTRSAVAVIAKKMELSNNQE